MKTVLGMTSGFLRPITAGTLPRSRRLSRAKCSSDTRRPCAGTSAIRPRRRRTSARASRHTIACLTNDATTNQSTPAPIRLRSVRVDGLSSDNAKVAEREAHVLVELAQRSPFDLRKPVEITVCFSADMAAAIDRFSHEHGLPSTDYKRQRPDGIAFGIVLTHPGNTDTADHTIVADASLWMEQSDSSLTRRMFGLAYLMGHLLNRHDRKRPEPEALQLRGQHARAMRGCSDSLQSIWSDSILALDLCNSCLRDQAGDPIQLSNFLAADVLGMVSELIDQMCVFATFDVNAYRVFGIDLEDLYPTAMNLACGLLRTTVVLIVLSAAGLRIDPILGSLSGLNGYSEFLGPVLPAVLEGCVNEDASTRAPSFERALTELLGRMGLRIEDMEADDIYVHVEAPVTCSWLERLEEHD